MPFLGPTGNKYYQLGFAEPTNPGKSTVLDLLKEIILDFQELTPPTGVPRRVAKIGNALGRKPKKLTPSPTEQQQS